MLFCLLHNFISPIKRLEVEEEEDCCCLTQRHRNDDKLACWWKLISGHCDWHYADRKTNDGCLSRCCCCCRYLCGASATIINSCGRFKRQAHDSLNSSLFKLLSFLFNISTCGGIQLQCSWQRKSRDKESCPSCLNRWRCSFMIMMRESWWFLSIIVSNRWLNYEFSVIECPFVLVRRFTNTGHAFESWPTRR